MISSQRQYCLEIHPVTQHDSPSLGGQTGYTGMEPGLASGVQRKLVASLNMLRDTTLDEEEHGRVIWTIAQIGKSATSPLLDVLNDAHAAVRQRAAAALGQIRDERAVDALAGCIHDSDHAVRRTSAWALGAIAHDRAVPALLEALNDERLEVRQRAAWALGEIGDRQAVEGLLDTLHDENHFVRIAASKALGELRDKRAVPALIDALKSADGGTRQIAAAALGNIRDPQAVPYLIPLLADTYFLYEPGRERNRICDTVARALQQIGTDEALAAVGDYQDNA